MTGYTKKYFEELMKPLGVSLDSDQRKAIRCDAPHLLIVAGAGAGKTTTMVAKAKHLVKSGIARPYEILIISFTNHAVDDFKVQLKQLDKDARWEVLTFHKLGYRICNQAEPKAFNILDTTRQSTIILEAFKELIEDKQFAENVVLFFGSYFGYPFDEIKASATDRYFNSNETLRSCVDELAQMDIEDLNKENLSIRYESLRSREEVDIANYLYLHGIDYEYEKEYPHPIFRSDRTHRPYTPDFYIRQGDKEAYIEHFGITEDGTSDRYDEKELRRYIENIRIKKQNHARYGTKLITTYSSYKDEEMDYLQDLERQLMEMGFELKEPDPIQVCRNLVNANINQQFRKFAALLSRFINLFKSKNYPAAQFDQWIEKFRKQNKPRYYLFLAICKHCYLRYQSYLDEHGFVDFEDMINNTREALENINKYRWRSRRKYKYILIDEYQDISENRLDFAKLLSDYYGASVTAVGDDWQTIFSYAGSNDKLFRSFTNDFKDAEKVIISNTYRNSQELIDVAGRFVMKNRNLIRKELKSAKRMERPIYIHAYQEYDGMRPKSEVFGENVTSLLRKLKAENPGADWSNEKILLLGRFGFDGKNLKESGFFDYVKGNSAKEMKSTEPDLCDLHLDFLTIHKAKGATYDHVIILNAKDEVFGFPSQIMNEPILNLVANTEPKKVLQEERRLFYVALTRTKNRVYIMTPEKKPSEFVVELLQHYRHNIESNVEHLNLQERELHTCPICEAPLQYRKSRIANYRKDGSCQSLSVWECTADPEVCGFMTNRLEGGYLSIQKCPDENCTGYLIVKEKDGDHFLACTNFHKPGLRCKETISLQQYACDCEGYY